MGLNTRSRCWLLAATLTSSLIGVLGGASVTHAIEATRFEIEFHAPDKREPVNRAIVWIAKGMVRIE